MRSHANMVKCEAYAVHASGFEQPATTIEFDVTPRRKRGIVVIEFELPVMSLLLTSEQVEGLISALKRKFMEHVASEN